MSKDIIASNEIPKPPPDFLARDFDPNLATLEDFKDLRIDEKTNIPKPETIINANGQIIAEAGDITTFSGASKAGKSAITCYIIADAISRNTLDAIPGLNVKKNHEHKAIIHLDCEQSRYGHQRNFILQILRRANLVDSPDYLLSYNLRKLSLAEYEPVTNGICAAAKKEFDGIFLLIVDGIADYTSDPNNETESRNIVKYFQHIAEKYECAVLVIVHLNPTPGDRKPEKTKERGHLGSELQRKSQSLITMISTKDGISTMHAKLFRNAGKEDFKPISIRYDKEKKYHVHYEIETDGSREELVELAQKVFGSGNAYGYKEAYTLIMNANNCKESTAKKLLKEMKDQGLVTKDPNDDKWQKNPYADY